MPKRGAIDEELGAYDISGHEFPARRGSHKALPRVLSLRSYDREMGPQGDPWFISGSDALAAAAGTLQPWLNVASATLARATVGRLEEIAFLFDSRFAVAAGGAISTTAKLLVNDEVIGSGWEAVALPNGLTQVVFDKLNLRVRAGATVNIQVIEANVSTYRCVVFGRGWYWPQNAGF